MTETTPARIKHVPSNWQGMVMVCRKCSKKIGGGFGPKRKTALAKALRRELATKKGRKGNFGIAEVGCLGVCPGNAVTLVDGARPDNWLIVPRGSDVTALAQALAPDQPE